MKNKMNVPFSDLAWQWKTIEKNFMPKMYDLFNNTQFCLGPAVVEFEKSFARYMDAAFAIGVNSGTSALHLALIAAGIGPNDKVLIPSHTFIATAWAVLYVGAIPVLCDVEEATGNIDVKDAEKRLTKDVKAIIPVHLYGQPANMTAVLQFADKHQLKVIEDACQAHGAYYQKKRVGSFGISSCFSFYPGKNLGAFGEAGMIITNDEGMAKRMQSLRQHAQKERYIHQELGFNYRMEGIQAAVLSEKLAYLEQWTARRREIAKQYLDGMKDLPIQLPHIVHDDHVYHLFVIRSKERDRLREHLEQQSIATGLHYPVPLHHQPCLQYLGADKNSFPVSDIYANHGLSLPLYESMTEQQVAYVISMLRAFF